MFHSITAKIMLLANVILSKADKDKELKVLMLLMLSVL